MLQKNRSKTENGRQQQEYDLAKKTLFLKVEDDNVVGKNPKIGGVQTVLYHGHGKSRITRNTEKF